MKILLYFLIIQSYILQCQDGCLQCQQQASSSQRICNLCDASNNYYLKDNQCVISNLNSCLTSDPFLNNCLQCQTDYYIDSNTKNCIAIEETKKITNCDSYDSSQNCLYCKPSYFLSNNQCQQVTQQIQNCKVYSNEKMCSQCEDNYFLSIDTQECIQINTNQNCLIFSQFECQKCKSGYIIDYTIYQKSLYLPNAGQSQLRLLYNLLEQDGDNKLSINDSINVCQKIEIENCMEYKNYQECSKCNKGYYLKNKICEQNPQDKIPNCKIYQTVSKCIECEQSFILKSNTECIAIETTQLIEHCQEYYTDISSVQCKQCNQTHFIVNNKCEERQNLNIENCQTLYNKEDNCEICFTDYVLIEQKFCDAKIPNCKQQSRTMSSDNNYQSICAECEQKYILTNDKMCIEGQIQNCNSYSQGGSLCNECENKFFKVNQSQCYPHIEISQCSIYSKSRQNICDLCEQGYYSLEIHSRCEDREHIYNCTQYTFENEKSICQSCSDGYYLQDNYCLTIPVNNCKTYDSNVCTSCMNNTVLIEKKIDEFENVSIECVEPFSYLYQFCSQDSNLNNKSNDTKCEFCNQGSFPYNNSKNFVCTNQSKVSETSIDLFYEINGCNAYDKSGFCVRCQNGKYSVNGGLQCASECPSIFYTFTAEVTDSIIDIKNINTCGVTLLNDLVSAPSIQDQSSITIKCKDWITVVENIEGANLDILYSNVNPQINTTSQGWVQDPLDVFNSVKCPQYQSLAKIDGKTVESKDTNRMCELYYDFGFNQYGCIKCPFGYRGSYTDFPSPSDGKSSLGTCNKMLECESSIQYKNINSYWNQFFSCHKCTFSDQIPVLIPLMYGLNNPNIVGFQEINKNPFTIQFGNERKLQNFLYYPLTCVNMTTELTIAADLNITTQRATSQYINKLIGCGLAVHNPNYTDSNFDNTDAFSTSSNDFPQNDKTGLFCVTCKPGYKAYYWNNQKNVVRQCEVIDNCIKNGKVFNACEQCESGYAYNYDSTLGIQYDKCVQMPNINNGLQQCYAYQQNSVTTLSGLCKICKKGYYLNQDNYCEQITAPYCNSGQFVDYNTELAHKKNSRYNYYVYQNGYGCIECSGGFVSLDIESFTVKEFCVNSEYINQNSTNFLDKSNQNDSSFINNCQLYKNNSSNITCQQCYQNYVLSEDGKKCINQSIQNNCMLFTNSQNQCVKCQEGYSLLTNGQCQFGNLANCKSYYSDEQKTQVMCKQCHDGFYLEDDNVTCTQGLIQNCKQYKDYNQLLCNECYQGFKVSSDLRFCFENLSFMNCKDPQITQSGYQCTQDNCNNLYSQLVDNFSDTLPIEQQFGKTRGICVKLNQIDNCKIYTQMTSSWTKFSCNECEQNFYLRDDQKACLQRQNIVQNCENYEINSDQCKSCFTNYYLDFQNGKSMCIESPSGAQNCDEYIYDVTTGLNCQQCKKLFYLDNLTCKKIPTESIINNCEIQTSLTTCNKCEKNYFLENNICIQVNVSNCLEYVNSESCKKCYEGYRLVKQENNNTLCESFNKPNCDKYDQTGNNKCLLCYQHFYPNLDGDCIKVPKEIPECLEYQSEILCQKCTENYALSNDNTQCLQKQIFDSNCAEQIITHDLKCNLCKAGYEIKGIACQSSLMNGPGSGCFMPDQQDQSRCYLCQTNYYMDDNFKCQNQRSNSNDDDEKDSNNNQNKLSFISYMILLVFIEFSS